MAFMRCNLKDNILQFDRAVPRYTSYPTAPQFRAIEDNNFSPYDTLQPSDMLSLYIHVPFCPKMCWYCGCHTKITKKYDPVEAYVELLLQEIDLLSTSITASKTISHIHFGGGSPGMLSAKDFKRIMDRIRSHFTIKPGAEIAIELDPRGVTEGRIATYAACGVNRVSLGAQDFNDIVLASVNRQQPFHLSYQTVKLLREYGINALNLDLIYGLPHQNIETTQHTIDLALSLNPDRIAFFGYAHVPWMKKHMRLIDEATLPNKDLRFDIFQSGAEILEDRGYKAIGIDHFVKPTDTMTKAYTTKTLHRNFQGYTTDAASALIGIGVSSIGQTASRYLQNTPDMPIYKSMIEDKRLPVTKHCPITQQDTIRADIIEQIMCYLAVDLRQFNGDYAAEVETLRTYEDAGLITISDDASIITIMPQARPIARLVAAAFDQYLPSVTEQKHSKAV